MVFDRERDILHPTGSRGAFYYEDFIAHEPLAAEQRWGAVEQEMRQVYQLLARREVFNHPQAVATLRDLLAVHWARSPAIRLMHERVGAGVAEDQRRAWAARPDLLARAFTERTGLAPAGPEALDWINQQLHVLDPGVPERWFSDRNQIHYGHARDRFARSPLQIGYAADGEFLIGDVPVITLRPGHHGTGPHQAVALGDATQILMPISPTVMISLGPESLEVDLAQDAVEQFNLLQMRSYIRWVGCRPGSAAHQQLRSLTNPRTELAHHH